MSDLPRCVRVPGLHRVLAGPLALCMTLALTASGCSPDSAPSPDGTTSKVPEIAKRQKHMAEILKKGESKAKSPAAPQ
jgi:hypothetical protein